MEQKQIAQGIKFGQRPPSLRKSEGDEGSSDEEEVPPSPLKVLAQVEAEPANTEPKVKNLPTVMIICLFLMESSNLASQTQRFRSALALSDVYTW